LFNIIYKSIWRSWSLENRQAYPKIFSHIDFETQQSIVSVFKIDNRERLEQIKQILTKQFSDQVIETETSQSSAKLIHAFAGSCGAMGLTCLQNMSLHLEKMLKISNSPSEIKLMLALIQEHWLQELIWLENPNC